MDHLSLLIQPGEVFGFVGPNGAGRTSTIRMIAGLLGITSGELLVGGHSVTHDKDLVLGQTGYMPDYFGLYPDLKVWEYLDFFAACYDIPESDRPGMISDLLDLVDLSGRRDDMVDKLSRGMKQRLCLARTLVHDPQILILDEPASGLEARPRLPGSHRARPGQEHRLQVIEELPAKVLWKVELQTLATETGLGITICHFPPGTSKWNKIEHRLFSHISMNWRGRPLVSHEVIVNLIGKTSTRNGLRVKAKLDRRKYPTKVKVSDEELERVKLKPHSFHGEWNYSISP